ncbi:MAG: winged helix-turn-helix domain-containing protein [Ferroplasma sp.]|uniref:winged helix-turn-helix domain-containing protein n=1 Tax=Ferroplasma sp. TaxID=2591003 RepID=UPI00281599AD|nr:winged helix-turn-helix domain-containing protein [Ferroplasma sp.]WMT51808.1 MAG: winged helix-turn-helix domain-containing protein [Ferroplasma sp.]
MVRNNDEYAFELESWCIGAHGTGNNYSKIVKDSTGLKIFLLFLPGTIIDKINILKNVSIPEEIERENRIAVYSGMVDSNIKKLADSINIQLVKSLRFNSGLYNIIVRVNNYAVKKPFLSSRAKRSKVDIQREILESIISNPTTSITKIVYRCNLNYRYCTNLISEMLKLSYLQMIEDGSGMRYTATSKGIKYLNNLRKLNPS